MENNMTFKGIVYRVSHPGLILFMKIYELSRPDLPISYA
jgi:hypothetical protein